MRHALATLPLTLVLTLSATPGSTPATDDADEPDDQETDDAAGQGLVSGDGYSVVGALSEVSATVVDADGFLLVTADVAAAAERAGLERPAGDDEAVIDWFGPLTGLPLSPPDGADAGFAPIALVPPAWMLDNIRDPAVTREALGWAVTDVDAFVSAENPPRTFSVIAGDFDDDTLAASLPEVADGVVTLGEGEDLASSLDQPSPLSRIGVPQRLAADDGRIAFGPVLDDVIAWSADQDDGRPVATDDDAVRAVAAALDEADVVAAVLSPTAGADPVAVLGRNATPELIAELEERFELAASLPLDVVGIGWSTDEQGASVITAAYHVAAGSPGDVTDGLREVYEGDSFVTREPIGDQVEVESVDAGEDVVVVTLRPAEGRSPLVLYQMLLQRDTPFAVGPA